MHIKLTGPNVWTNAKVLAVDVRVSREVALPLLPDALRLADPATATLFVADYPETQFGSVYREAGLLLHVQDKKGPALHCPWMVVDEDTALILGREMLGFPKRMAEIRFEAREGGVLVTVSRRATEIMRIESAVFEAETEPEPFFGRRMVNVIGTLPTGLKLIELPPMAEVFRSARRAEARVTLTSSDRDPLGELQAVPTGRARSLQLDFGSVSGARPQVLGDADAEWVARRFFARAL